MPVGGCSAHYESLCTQSDQSVFNMTMYQKTLGFLSIDPNVLTNYKPISNLPFISRILEKVVLNQLYTHLQNNRLYKEFVLI